MTRRTVIVAGSRAGATVAERLAAALPGAEAFVSARWAPLAGTARPLDATLAQAVPAFFRDPSVGSLVVVLALGATVRLLAPALRGKELDPAVVAVDDQARFAIPLIGGHRAGANALATRVARALEAVPVITTASDAAGVLAVDLLGADEGWRIEATPEGLRGAAAALVNGETVGVYQDAGGRSWRAGGVPANLRTLANLQTEETADCVALLLISDRLLPVLDRPACQVTYRPPTLIAGIGCSRGASVQDLAEVVDLGLAQGRLARSSIAAIATIDRRLDEPGMTQLAVRLGVPLKGYPAEVLATVSAIPTPSAIVQAAVGSPGVCEPAALLASGASELLVSKVKTARATAAIARQPQEVDDSRLGLHGVPSWRPGEEHVGNGGSS